jgi:hypothetical protein
MAALRPAARARAYHIALYLRSELPGQRAEVAVLAKEAVQEDERRRAMGWCAVGLALQQGCAAAIGAEPRAVEGHALHANMQRPYTGQPPHHHGSTRRLRAA